MKNDLKQLLKIKPESSKILLLLIPPIYFLWMCAVADKLVPDNSILKSVFKLLIIFIFSVFVFSTLFIFYFLARGYNLIQIKDVFLLIPLIGNIFWLIAVAILTKFTVDYERKMNTKKYYTLVDNMDYVKRFFTFVYWPFFIWRLQNQYMIKVN